MCWAVRSQALNWRPATWPCQLPLAHPAALSPQQSLGLAGKPVNHVSGACHLLVRVLSLYWPSCQLETICLGAFRNSEFLACQQPFVLFPNSAFYVLFLSSSIFWCTAGHVGSQFPDQGSNPCPLQWKHRTLTSRPPGKPSMFFFFKQNKMKLFIMKHSTQTESVSPNDVRFSGLS